MPETQVRSLVQEDPTCLGATEPNVPQLVSLCSVSVRTMTSSVGLLHHRPELITLFLALTTIVQLGCNYLDFIPEETKVQTVSMSCPTAYN